MKKLILLLSLLLLAAQVQATTYGRPIAIKCSGCNKVTMKEFPLLSGNTFGAIQWSDSKQNTPMLPEIPVIVKCPKCGTFVIPDKNHYTQEDAQQLIDGAANTRDCMLGFDDYLQAFDLIEDLNTGLLLTIYSYNDFYREHRAAEAEVDTRKEAFETIVTEFITTLDESKPDSRVMKAEFYREIGKFDQCIKLLGNKRFKGRLEKVRIQILARAKAKDKQVFVLKFD